MTRRLQNGWSQNGANRDLWSFLELSFIRESKLEVKLAVLLPCFGPFELRPSGFSPSAPPVTPVFWPLSWIEIKWRKYKMAFVCESSSCETTAITATKVNKLHFQPCCPGLLKAVKPSETLSQRLSRRFISKAAGLMTNTSEPSFKWRQFEKRLKSSRKPVVHELICKPHWDHALQAEVENCHAGFSRLC